MVAFFMVGFLGAPSGHTVNGLFSAQCAKESLFFCQFFCEKFPL